MRILIAAIAIALIGSAAPAENAASEHHEKWEELRDRGAGQDSDAAAEEDREKAPRGDQAQPQPDGRSAESDDDTD